MRTALKDGTVITARACARLGNAAVPIITSAIIRYAWEASAGIGNAIISSTAKTDTIVSRREYAKRCVHQTALVRIPSAVQSTIQGRRTESAGISRNQKSGVCWSLAVISVAAPRATSAKNTITTGESVKRSRSLLARVTAAVRKHTAALAANASHGRKPSSGVLTKGLTYTTVVALRDIPARNTKTTYTGEDANRSFHQLRSLGLGSWKSRDQNEFTAR